MALRWTQVIVKITQLGSLPRRPEYTRAFLSFYIASQISVRSTSGPGLRLDSTIAVWIDPKRESCNLLRYWVFLRSVLISLHLDLTLLQLKNRWLRCSISSLHGSQTPELTVHLLAHSLLKTLGWSSRHTRNQTLGRGQPPHTLFQLCFHSIDVLVCPHLALSWEVWLPICWVVLTHSLLGKSHPRFPVVPSQIHPLPCVRPSPVVVRVLTAHHEIIWIPPHQFFCCCIDDCSQFWCSPNCCQQWEDHWVFQFLCSPKTFWGQFGALQYLPSHDNTGLPSVRSLGGLVICIRWTWIKVGGMVLPSKGKVADGQRSPNWDIRPELVHLLLSFLCLPCFAFFSMTSFAMKVQAFFTLVISFATCLIFRFAVCIRMSGILDHPLLWISWQPARISEVFWISPSDFCPRETSC